MMDGKTIDEAAVNGWLDEIYAGETLIHGRLKYDKVATRLSRKFSIVGSH